MFYVTKNHERDLKSAVLIAAVTPDIKGVKLVRLHGKLSIKASEEVMLYVSSTGIILSFKVMDKSIFTMYEA